MKKIKGQSLIEVTVATGIIAVTVLGILTLAINTIGYSLSSKMKSQAIALAQQGLEEKRAEGGCALSAIDSGWVDITGFDNHQRRIQISSPTASNLPAGESTSNYWMITSTVRWYSKGTPTGDISVYGLVAKND